MMQKNETGKKTFRICFNNTRGKREIIEGNLDLVEVQRALKTYRAFGLKCWPEVERQ